MQKFRSPPFKAKLRPLHYRLWSGLQFSGGFLDTSADKSLKNRAPKSGIIENKLTTRNSLTGASVALNDPYICGIHMTAQLPFAGRDHTSLKWFALL